MYSQRDRSQFLYKLTSDAILKNFPSDDSILGNRKYRDFHFNAYELGFIGEYNLSLAKDNLFSYSNKDTVWKKSEIEKFKEIQKNYFPKNAKEYILEKARQNKIIIINEAHSQAMHRVYTTSLLKGLRENGYKYLAIEALEADTLLNHTKQPTIHNGYYTRDPQFGNMLRVALSLGYTLVSYEYDGDDWSKRELGQAENIKKILDNDSTAKILVHCGYGHGIKDTTESKMMAAYLKEITGINPLTIDQIALSEQSKPNFETSAFLALKAETPSVFENSNHELLNVYSQYDITVYHPRTILKKDRPKWLVIDSSQKYHRVNLNKLDIKFPVLAIAYLEKDDIKKSIPVDIVEIKEKNAEKYLILRQGKYNIILRNSLNEERSYIVHIE